jgi:hypothetical protein
MINNQSRYINTISSNTSLNVNVNFTTATTNKNIGVYGKHLIGGQNYSVDKLPTITVSSTSGANANLSVIALMGDGESLTPFIGNTQPGQIISIKVVSGGSGYQYIPQVDLTGSGDGTATAALVWEDTIARCFLSLALMINQSKSQSRSTFGSRIQSSDALKCSLSPNDIKKISKLRIIFYIIMIL